MKVIIAGTREFDNYNYLCYCIDSLIRNEDLKIDEVVCGGAKGADELGKRYAKERNIPVKMFPAMWDAYGNSAGVIRNHQMAEYGDYLIAFWDKRSKGTKEMIEYMRKTAKKNGTVFYV